MKRIVLFVGICGIILVGAYFLFSRTIKTSSIGGVQLPQIKLPNSSSNNIAIGIHTEDTPQIVEGNFYTLYTASNMKLMKIVEGGSGANAAPTQLDFEYTQGKSTATVHLETKLPFDYIDATAPTAGTLGAQDAKIGKLYNVRFLVPQNDTSARALSNTFCIRRSAFPKVAKADCVQILDDTGKNFLSPSQLTATLQQGRVILKANQVLVSSIILQPYQ